jgi:hypothetical protein
MFAVGTAEKAITSVLSIIEKTQSIPPQALAGLKEKMESEDKSFVKSSFTQLYNQVKKSHGEIFDGANALMSRSTLMSIFQQWADGITQFSYSSHFQITEREFEDIYASYSSETNRVGSNMAEVYQRRDAAGWSPSQAYRINLPETFVKGIAGDAKIDGIVVAVAAFHRSTTKVDWDQYGRRGYTRPSYGFGPGGGYDPGNGVTMFNPVNANFFPDVDIDDDE